MLLNPSLNASICLATPVNKVQSNNNYTKIIMNNDKLILIMIIIIILIEHLPETSINACELINNYHFPYMSCTCDIWPVIIIIATC